MSSTAARMISKITPECANLHRTIGTASYISLAISTILFIFLLAIIIYNYVVKSDNNNNNNNSGVTADGDNSDDKKKKVIGGLTITCAIISLFSALASLWPAMIGSKLVKTCT